MQVCLQQRGEYLSLHVLGLAEGRPSVLVGDRIYLTAPGDAEYGPQYEGIVHEVCLRKGKGSFYDRSFQRLLSDIFRSQIFLTSKHFWHRSFFRYKFMCNFQVLHENVLLKFNEDFHSRYGGEDYDVRFSFNR